MFDLSQIAWAWTCVAPMVAGAYLLLVRRARRKPAGAAPASSHPDRWIVLEIERKGKSGDGMSWEVRDNREAVQ